jgi:phosphotransferase system HPr-like phosphotransfer protein
MPAAASAAGAALTVVVLGEDEQAAFEIVVAILEHTD